MSVGEMTHTLIRRRIAAKLVIALVLVLITLSFYESFIKRREISNSNEMLASIERRVVAVDGGRYQQYTGIYQLEPRFNLSISTEDQRLFAQGSNQIRVEIFPASQDTYFNTYTNALITFHTNGEGETSTLTLRQIDKIRQGKKIGGNGKTDN